MSDAPDPETLAERVSRAVSSALSRQPDADGLDEYGGRGRVPYDRFRQAIDARNQAREELTELRRQVTDLQSAYTAKYDALKTETATQVAGIAQKHQEDLQLVSAGIRDDLGRVAVRQAWEAQPADARGDSPAAWWSQVVEGHAAHSANPDEAPAVEVPRVLLGYLPEQAAPAAAQKARPPQVDQGARRRQPANVQDRLAALPSDASIEDVLRSLQGA